MPKVSIVLPTFNRAPVLGRAIDSVLSQTFSDFELLICDDCSTDNSDALISSFIKRDNRIKYFCTNRNLGAGAARNLGFKHARSDYIAFLDSDDEWTPNKLQVQISHMDNLPESIGICFCGATIIKNENYSKQFYYKPNRHWTKHSYKKFALGKLPFLTPTIVIRKRCIEICGIMNENMRRNQDVEFFLRILQQYRLTIVDEAHCIIHMQVSRQKHVYDHMKAALPYHEDHFQALSKQFGIRAARLYLCFHRNNLLCAAIREKNAAEVLKCLSHRMQILPWLTPNELKNILRSFVRRFIAP